MKQSLQTILWLTFARYVLAVSVTYRAFLRGFTRKISAFEAQVYAFGESARRYGAHLVLSRHTTRFAVWACALCHSGTFFAGDAANTHFQATHHRETKSWRLFLHTFDSSGGFHDFFSLTFL